MRRKSFTFLCGKLTQDNAYLILSESVGFCRKYDENMLVFFSVHSAVFRVCIIDVNGRLPVITVGLSIQATGHFQMLVLIHLIAA